MEEDRSFQFDMSIKHKNNLTLIEIIPKTKFWASLALLVLKKEFKKYGINTEIFRISKLDEDNITYEKLASQIIKKNPHHIGFSSPGSIYVNIILLSKEIKKQSPETTIFLGGPHASIVDKETLEKFSCIDFICRGEAERVVPHLADYFRGKEKLENIPNLTYRKDGRVVRNESAELIKGEEIPSIVYEKETVDKIEESSGKRSIFLEGGRGCVGNCTFCSTSNFWKKKCRNKPINDLIKEIKQNVNQVKAERVDMIHDNFASDRKKLKKFCKKIKKMGVKWSCSSRIDILNEKVIKSMDRSGCYQICSGIESWDKEIQKKIKKNINLERAEKLIDYTIKNTEINLKIPFIVGFPFETPKSLKSTMEKYFELATVLKRKENAIMASLEAQAGSELYKTKKVFNEKIEKFSRLTKQTRFCFNPEKEKKLIRENENLFGHHYKFESKIFNPLFFESVQFICDLLNRYFPKTTYLWINSFPGTGEEFIEAFGSVMNWKNPYKPKEREVENIIQADTQKLIFTFIEHFKNCGGQIKKEILREEVEIIKKNRNRSKVR